MELKEFFAEVGGDYEKVLHRIPSAEMVKRFVYKFAKDPSYAELQKALEREEIAEAFRMAHTLKGTAANLGLDGLAAAASELTEELRGASQLPAKETIEAVDEMYRKTMEKISLLSEQ